MENSVDTLSDVTLNNVSYLMPKTVSFHYYDKMSDTLISLQ